MKQVTLNELNEKIENLDSKLTSLMNKVIELKSHVLNQNTPYQRFHNPHVSQQQSPNYDLAQYQMWQMQQSQQMQNHGPVYQQFNPYQPTPDNILSSKHMSEDLKVRQRLHDIALLEMELMDIVKPYIPNASRKTNNTMICGVTELKFLEPDLAKECLKKLIEYLLIEDKDLNE